MSKKFCGFCGAPVKAYSMGYPEVCGKCRPLWAIVGTIREVSDRMIRDCEDADLLLRARDFEAGKPIARSAMIETIERRLRKLSGNATKGKK